MGQIYDNKYLPRKGNNLLRNQQGFSSKWQLSVKILTPNMIIINKQVASL